MGPGSWVPWSFMGHRKMSEAEAGDQRLGRLESNLPSWVGKAMVTHLLV